MIAALWSIQGKAALRAVYPPVRELHIRKDVATFSAGLRCARWINLDDYAPSFFRFGVQPLDQIVPSGIEDAL